MAYTRTSRVIFLGCSMLFAACASDARPNVQVNDGSVDASALDGSAPNDMVAPNDTVAPNDMVVPDDMVAPNDAVAPDAAQTDGAAPDDAADVPAMMCMVGQTNCGGVCLDTATNISNCGGCGVRCPSMMACVRGTCTGEMLPDGGMMPPDVPPVMCGVGQTNCGGSCVVTTSDPFNCGICGNRCTSTQLCGGGMCVPRMPADGGVPPSDGGVTCAAGLADCGGFCINLQTDPGHCGACPTVCSASQMCTAGACVPLSTPTCTMAGFGLCGGFCINLQTDPGHCGACPTMCSSSQICRGGVCVTGTPDGGTGPAPDAGPVTCAAGLTACGGVCNNLQADPNHCGTCTTVCSATQVCSAGRCSSTGGSDAGSPDAGSVTCSAGLTNCGGVCNDLQADPSHCGTCTTVCPAGQFCSAGRCSSTGGSDAGSPDAGGVTCGAGLTNCGGVCNNLQTDPGRCGSCTTACSATQVCMAGSCMTVTGGGDAGTTMCGAGLTNCGGVCNDLQNDPTRCGTCTTACTATQMCSAGRCVTAGGGGGDGGTPGRDGGTEPCGAIGAPCCTAAGSMPCPSGISCVSGRCAEPTGCGNSGQPCCTGSTCAPMLTCSAGTCR